MERPGTVWLFLVLCAPALASGGNHAFEVLRTANQHYRGINFFAIEARLPSDGLSSSENWCRDYQNLCAEYGLRPTGCGESWAVNGGDRYDFPRCVTEYNSDPYINDVLSCNPSVRVAEVANLAFSAGATRGRSFGFHICDTSHCQRGIVDSWNSLTYTDAAFPGDRIVYTVCRGSANIDWCTQGQGYCPFGWICEDQVTHFICHATSNNLKSLYQCDSNTCPNGMTCMAEGPGSFSCRAG